ncbi:putative oxidoreductase [Micractinium conductrix]|uniref:Oxidoreductase n=1 Tax=Micractinium conductrix TaxID=554055 RepID=A0A2P6VR87_9CHLO|nr:putative oxidoreductase [Micractinium conductrix]|eukprot:PSC76608.1 putative oxidoreductase [Micractinium conductrix]
MRHAGRACANLGRRAYSAATTAAAPPPPPAPRQRTALVQGSNRGLGLEFVRQLLLRPDTAAVVATCRSPGNAAALQALAAAQPAGRLSILQLDSTDERSIAAAAEQVAARQDHLDVLINASGILHDDGMSPETALARVTMDNLLKCFQVNAAGHILVCSAFAPLLAAAKSQNGATEEHPAVVANLSARVGSIGDNRLGGWYSYRASKAAVNQLTKCMAVEFERRQQHVAAILLHPGTVDTDLSRPFQKNVPAEKLFTRERAIQQLLAIIDRTSMAENGRFYDWQGAEVEW